MTDGGNSLAEVRGLLATLVASKPQGCIAEVGTSFGVGTRAMARALGADATLLSVEPNVERLDEARLTLVDSRVDLVHGRWEDVLPERAPFDLIFFDGGVSNTGLRRVVDRLAPGGILIKDDMTPGRPTQGDFVREVLLLDPHLQSVELLTTPKSSVILATRVA